MFYIGSKSQEFQPQNCSTALTKTLATTTTAVTAAVAAARTNGSSSKLITHIEEPHKYNQRTGNVIKILPKVKNQI